MEKKMMVEIPAEEMTAVESRFYTRKAMENLINILCVCSFAIFQTNVDGKTE